MIRPGSPDNRSERLVADRRRAEHLRAAPDGWISLKQTSPRRPALRRHGGVTGRADRR